MLLLLYLYIRFYCIDTSLRSQTHLHPFLFQRAVLWLGPATSIFWSGQLVHVTSDHLRSINILIDTVAQILHRQAFLALQEVHGRVCHKCNLCWFLCERPAASCGPWGHGQAPVCNCYIMQRVSGSSLRGLDPQWCRFCSVSQVSACSKTRTGFSRLLHDGFHQDAARRFWCCYWGLLLELKAPVGWGCL